MDDLNVINDGGELGHNFTVIYPEELQLNKENSNNLEASFLDLHIKIENGKFVVGLFDKRELSLWMPYKSSNLPSKMFNSAIGAETLNIAKANNNGNSFNSFVKPVMFRVFRMINSQMF